MLQCLKGIGDCHESCEPLQAAVVGLSCSWDADQLLEKRLASRFSARSLVVASPATGAEDPEEAPAAMLRAHLRVHGTASAAGHEMQDGFAAECNGALEAALKAPAVETALQSLSDRGMAQQHSCWAAPHLMVHDMLSTDAALQAAAWPRVGRSRSHSFIQDECIRPELDALKYTSRPAEYCV